MKNHPGVLKIYRFCSRPNERPHQISDLNNLFSSKIRLESVKLPVKSKMADYNDPDGIRVIGYDTEMEAYYMSPMALSFEAAGIIGLCATTIIGNALLFVLGHQRPSRAKLANIILLSVALADIFTAVVTMPLMVAALLELRWRYGDSLCKSTGVLTFVFICMACLALFIVVLNHLAIVICCCKEANNMKSSLILIVVLFLSLSAAAMFFLIDWKRFSRTPTRMLCRLANSPNFVAYKIFYCVFSLLIPFMLMILLMGKTENEHT